ncbi:MAG: DUF2247 family protein [Planctomycetaceae bacterium]|nr:DUF2247 family protein [Planctomycetaceae bacterium]
MFRKNGNCCAEIEILQRFELLYWKTALICLKNKWYSTDDLVLFAFACLESNIADTDYRVALIADGNYYKSDIDFLEVVETLAKDETIDDLVAEEIWILARLIAIKESNEGDDVKYEELQNIIESAHKYPPTLYDCYQYRKQSDLFPFDAINEVIENLQSKLASFRLCAN